MTWILAHWIPYLYLQLTTSTPEKEAMDAINKFGKQHNYALTTKGSKRHGDCQTKARYPRCNRSGVYKNNLDD